MPAPSPTRVRSIAVVMALLLLVPATTALAAVGEGPARSNGIFVEPGLEYVAIAPSQLARYLTPLIEWKMDRGVPSQIFNVDQVLGAYPGRDDAERLHNFLQDLYYNKTDGTPRWLLLAGDTGLVPLRYLWADRDHSGSRTHERNLYVGDMYYSGLGTDWDLDGDGVYGEPGEEDPSSELYVGRIAANLPEQLEAAVSKVLAYELEPPGGDWFHNALLAGALMDEPNRLDNPYTLPTSSGYSDEGFDPYTDNAYEVTQKVRAVMGEGYDFIELVDYPFFEGCLYTAENDSLHQEAVQAAWGRGNAFVFMASHGYEAFGGLAEYEGTGLTGMFESARPFFTWQDAEDPATGGMLPLVYISSCYAGQYDKDDYTNFESALYVPEGGAIGVVAGDGDTFRLENISTESFGNWWLGERFWQLVVDEGRVRPGEALGILKEEYHTYYLTQGPPPTDRINMDYFYSNLYAYNLMGDPEVPVWVGAPGRLRMEVLSGAVFNSLSLRVRVTDDATGEPVEGATVHARGSGLAVGTRAVTGPDGLAVIPQGPSVLGEELRLATTAANWVPAREVVTVTEGERDLTVTADDLPSTLPYDGGLVTVTVTVVNEGDFDARSIAVLFDSGDTDAPDSGGIDGRRQTVTVDVEVHGSRSVDLSHRYTGPGLFNLSVFVDADHRYPEVDETDNSLEWQLMLRPLPVMPETIGPLEVVAGTVHHEPVDLTVHVEMPPGTDMEVTFEVGEVTEGVQAWLDGEALLRLRAGANATGTATVEVRMLALGVVADTTSVVLRVVGANAPPAIAPVPDAQARPGTQVEVVINVTDPDGDPVTIGWSLEGASMAGNVLRWTPDEGDVGVRYVHVTATDTSGGRSDTWFSITVSAENAAPRIHDGEDAWTVEEGEVLFIALGAVDDDGDPVSYHLASPDEGFSIDPDSGLVTFEAKGLAAGRYRATVVATDGQASDQRTLEVEVEDGSSLPLLALVLVGLAMVAAVGAALMFRP